MAAPPPPGSALSARSAALALAPWLAIFGLIAWAGSAHAVDGDESRYLYYADRILRGGYACAPGDGAPFLFLWNGPAYPLFLAALGGSRAPLWLPRLANAAWLWLGLWQVALALAPRLGRRPALLWAHGLGAYVLAYGCLADRLMTEPLAFACAAGFARQLLAPGRAARPAPLAALWLAPLVLAKVVFAYTLYGLIPLGAVASRLRGGEWGRGWGRAAAAAALALALCLPWLAYTRGVTGKFPYWSNAGGLQLYALTAPEPWLAGDWFAPADALARPDLFPSEATVLRAAAALPPVAQDSTLKAAALANLRRHPAKCLTNWRANLNRMAFGFPYSNFPGAPRAPATGNRAAVYAFGLLVAALGLAAALARPRPAPAGAWPLWAFCLISLAGLSALSYLNRFALPLLPPAAMAAALGLAGWRLRPPGPAG